MFQKVGTREKKEKAGAWRARGQPHLHLKDRGEQKGAEEAPFKPPASAVSEHAAGG